jgi:hypothetical protein
MALVDDGGVFFTVAATAVFTSSFDPAAMVFTGCFNPLVTVLTSSVFTWSVDPAAPVFTWSVDARAATTPLLLPVGSGSGPSEASASLDVGPWDAGSVEK